MTDGFKERLAKIVTISLIAVIGTLGALALWPTYLRGRELKKKDADLTLRIEEKKREIAKLIDYQKRFKTDPDLVERIARQNGRVYPGELVFIFDD